MTAWLLNQLAAFGDAPIALFFALFAATFVLEDAVSVTAGVLAGRMVIDPFVAVSAVVAGTIAGDLALHALGRWLAGTAFVKRLRARRANMDARLRQHGLLAVAIARFVPGTRFPVFLASGVVRTPLLASILTISLTTLAWTPGLFYLSYHAGALDLGYSNSTGLIAGALVLATFAIARRRRKSVGRFALAAT